MAVRLSIRTIFFSLVFVFLLVLIALLSFYFFKKTYYSEISLTSKSPGYQINWENKTTLDEFIETIELFTSPFVGTTQSDPVSIKNLEIELTSQEQKFFRVISAENKEMSYSSGYEVDGGKLIVRIFINPKLLSETDETVKNRVIYSLNHQLIQIISLSTYKFPAEENRKSDSESVNSSDQLLKKFVSDKNLEDLPLKLHKL